VHIFVVNELRCFALWRKLRPIKLTVFARLQNALESTNGLKAWLAKTERLYCSRSIISSSFWSMIGSWWRQNQSALKARGDHCSAIKITAAKSYLKFTF